MHATCYSVTAYLLIGTAMRIAFSLGLHRDVSLRNRDSLERERSRRLWWTIFILDYEMAGRFDYPSAVMEQTVYLRVPPATEQVRPFPHTLPSLPNPHSNPAFHPATYRFSTRAPTPRWATNPSSYPSSSSANA